VAKEAKITGLEAKLRQTLGERIRTLRKQRGVNQDDFAHLAGIHRTHVGMLENAKIDPKLSTLLRVARALDVKVSDLFGGTDEA
jgi:transcriptional regulator with XRE-family HTH domain